MRHPERGIFTLPNLLTLYRLLLAPILYFTLTEGMLGLSVFVFLLSGASDLADGFFARTLGEVSDLGKILDPIADKVTYFLAILGLIPRARHLMLLLIALSIKEGVSMVSALISIGRHARIEGARMHGKITGALLFGTVLLHMLFPTPPVGLSTVTLCLCLLSMTLSFALYLKEHLSGAPQATRNIAQDFIRRL